jgi:hypothetical protein
VAAAEHRLVLEYIDAGKAGTALAQRMLERACGDQFGAADVDEDRARRPGNRRG